MSFSRLCTLWRTRAAAAIGVAAARRARAAIIGSAAPIAIDFFAAITLIAAAVCRHCFYADSLLFAHYAAACYAMRHFHFAFRRLMLHRRRRCRRRHCRFVFAAITFHFRCRLCCHAAIISLRWFCLFRYYAAACFDERRRFHYYAAATPPWRHAALRQRR